MPYLHKQNGCIIYVSPQERACHDVGNSREYREFCFVPSGRFWMGSNRHEGYTECRHRPLHRLNLRYPYWISRYTIRGDEYGAFVKAGGNHDARFWPEAAAEGLWTEEGLQRQEIIGAGFAWYEALAYTRWLTEIMQAEYRLPQSWKVLLPSEGEWEKAARGGIRIPRKPVIQSPPIAELVPRTRMRWNPQPWRNYPWGNTVTPPAREANPYGCVAFCSGVLEWTRTLDGEVGSGRMFSYPYDPADGREELGANQNFLRVQRGGWSRFKPFPVRCVHRSREWPKLPSPGTGFRIVLASAG